MSVTPGEMPSQAADLGVSLVDRILSAAAVELITAGIKHTTIAGVARAAAVPEDAIYQRWTSVEALVTAVVVRDLHRRLEELGSAVGYRGRLDDQLSEAFASVLWFLDSHPLVGGAVRSNVEVILPVAEVSVAQIVGVGATAISNRIATIVADDTGRAVDSEALTEVLTRLIQSLLLTRGQSRRLATRQHVVDYARQCVVPLVGAFLV
jgi:AcrR family transcriptional regulator